MLYDIILYYTHPWMYRVSANEMIFSGVLTLTSNILIQKWRPERKKHIGLSENSVPLHPMVNDHYPY